MAATYRLDIRYIPQHGMSALKRVELLSTTLAGGGFSVSDVSVFDDGMRISALVSTESRGRNELRLLALVSSTGTIGRFSCRDVEKVSAAAEAEEERKGSPALA